MHNVKMHQSTFWFTNMRTQLIDGLLEPLDSEDEWR